MDQALEFCGVNFSYGEGNAFAIKNLDFSVGAGEFVAVLGHNGSGKSTLARLSNGLLFADSGEIRVFGKTLTEKNLREIRREVGIVFQNPDSQAVASIVEDDIAFGAENVQLPREEIGRRIEFALRAVGMEDFRTATVSRLSGGQKQRVAIAGVLALKPRVMILDEATAMLDPRGRREIVEVVRRLNREEGITVLMITHFMEEALLADRAIVLNRGEIVMEDAPAGIFSRHEELLTYNLTLPRIGTICKRLQAGGLDVPDTLDIEALSEAIATELSTGGSAQKSADGTAKSDTFDKSSDETAGGRALAEAPAHIVANRLNYTYNAKTPFAAHALCDVALTVREGEFFGIIGHTGSGKSTFVQHLNGLIRTPASLRRKKGTDPTELVVDGFDLTLKKTDWRALRKKVGMVFQYPESQLFAETVFDDVAFGYKNFAPEKPPKEEVERAVKEAVGIVGLDYDAVKDRSPFDLSGGQRRRAAIAGVIVTRPEILVLDEPAAGLDPLGKREIMQLLHDLHERWCKTIIVVSHDMDEIAENCTRAAVFENGSVKYVLTPKELFSHADELYALGLDIPLTAKLTFALKKRGVPVDCDYTTDGFVQAVLVGRGSC